MNASLFMNNPVMSNKKDYLPLWEVMCKGDFEVVEIFFGLGADPDQKGANKKFKGCTFLQHLASLAVSDYSTSCHRVAEALVRHGAEVNKSLTRNAAEAPLRLAIGRGNLKLCELFLKNGAILKTPERKASATWNQIFLIEDDLICKGMIFLLVRYGLDICCRDEEDKNLLHMYLGIYKTNKTNRALVAEVLLDFGIPVDEVDKEGASPLHRSILIRDNKLATLLIKRGADVNLVYKSEARYPLALAITEKNVELVKLLLSKGADPCSPDLYGFSPMHYACGSAVLEIIKILVRKGAKICAVNKLGRTPLHNAFTFEKPKYGECTVYVIKLIARILLLGKPILEGDGMLIKQNPKLDEILQACFMELYQMVKIKFYASYSYYHNVLYEDLEILAKLVKNEEFVKAFREKLSFPYYRDDLEETMEEAFRMRDETFMVYTALCSIFNDFLPDIVIRKLSEYLKIHDLPT